MNISDELRAIERDGFVVLDGQMEPGVLDQLQSELEPWLEQTPRCEGDFYGWDTTRVGGLLSKTPSVQQLVLDPRIMAIVKALLLPHCDCVQLNLTQAVRLHGGQRAQAPHRDEEMWPCDTQGRHWLINVMWAVSDFTADNGATRLWPGSHTQRLNRSIAPEASIPGEMKAGSALIFLGSLTHSGGANQTRTPRTGIIVSYCLGWLKTYENQFLAYPRETVLGFPDELQRLIGYRMHRPNLGGWEGRDPIEALRTHDRPPGHIDALTPDIHAQLRDFHGGAGGG